MDSVRLSKLLSKVLRHRADEYGIEISLDGYARVTDLLAHRDFRRCSIDDIIRVVDTNYKKRFELSECM